jgi:hypothetical protein
MPGRQDIAARNNQPNPAATMADAGPAGGMAQCGHSAPGDDGGAVTISEPVDEVTQSQLCEHG